MAVKHETAAEAVQRQQVAISEAARLLTESFNEMVDTIDPGTEDWGDVAEFAHIAEMAREVIARYEEQA